MELFMDMLPWAILTMYHVVFAACALLNKSSFPIMPAFSREAKVRKLRKKVRYYRDAAELSRARVWLELGCADMLEKKALELENA